MVLDVDMTVPGFRQHEELRCTLIHAGVQHYGLLTAPQIEFSVCSENIYNILFEIACEGE